MPCGFCKGCTWSCAVVAKARNARLPPNCHHAKATCAGHQTNALSNAMLRWHAFTCSNVPTCVSTALHAATKLAIRTFGACMAPSPAASDLHAAHSNRRAMARCGYRNTQYVQHRCGQPRASACLGGAHHRQVFTWGAADNRET